MLTTLLNESEKKGLKGLTSHSGLVKGELYTLTILNEANS